MSDRTADIDGNTEASIISAVTDSASWQHYSTGCQYCPTSVYGTIMIHWRCGTWIMVPLHLSLFFF